jgi:hypothetical protein
MNVPHRVINRLRREYNLFANRALVRKLEKEIARERTGSESDPVIVFNASTRLSGLSQNAGFSLVTSLALRAAGVPVIHFVCKRGMSLCVLGTDREHPGNPPPCAECTRTSRMVFSGADVVDFSYHRDDAIARQIQNLLLDDLLAYRAGDIPVGEIILPSLRWILRRHHLADDEVTRTIAREYILSACSLAQEIRGLIVRYHPRAAVVFNGMFYPEAVFKWIARSQGIPVYSHEVGMLPFTAFFTDQEATAYPVEVKDGFLLTGDQEERLDGYLAERMEGNFITAGIRFWPEIKNLDEPFLAEASAFKHIVPIFTNVIFDTSQGHANVMFTHMFEWLDSILSDIRNNNDTFFIIRAHPDELREGKESRETVAAWVADRSVEALPNVRFIPSDRFISSYDLINRSKFVMVYNSTIGLEASIMGKPVLCAGKARYTSILTVFAPQSRMNYMKILRDFLSADQVEHPSEFQRNARRMLYRQLFCASLPFGEYLAEDGVWRGYIRLKDFSLERLLPENSETMRVLLKGILENKPFIMEQ